MKWSNKKLVVTLLSGTLAVVPIAAHSSESAYEICYKQFMDDTPSNGVESWKEIKLRRYESRRDAMISIIEDQKRDWIDEKTEFVKFGSVVQRWEAKADHIFDPRIARVKQDHKEIEQLIRDRAFEYFETCRAYYRQDLPEMIVVSANGEPAESQTVLLEGESYVLKVTGTFQYDEGEAGTRADAQHEQNDDLTFSRRNFLAINGVTRPADAQIGPHAFEYGLSGNGEKLTLHIEDGGYADNAGSLTAELRADD